MEPTTGSTLRAAGIDAVTLKPSETAVGDAATLDVDLVCIDYEGREHVPDPETLADLGDAVAVRVTVAVRADGFDPRGDDSLLRRLPDSVGQVVVAGNPAYLSPEEQRRSVPPRLREAAERADRPWVGTESVERVALAVGGTQYELLSRTTRRDVRALRAAGFEGTLALYAPVVFSDDEDSILDAVGAYAVRRDPVRRALPAGTPTDSTATGEGRETLLSACRDYALVGTVADVRAAVDRLTEAGVDRVVAYPARGLDAL